jgi:tyrosinase
MHLPGFASAALALASTLHAAELQPRNLQQDLQDQALQNFKEAEANGTIAKGSCSLENAAVRKDW